MTRETFVRQESDGWRVVSTDGTEEWDIDGPFETEAEAIAAKSQADEMWAQAHPEEG